MPMTYKYMALLKGTNEETNVKKVIREESKDINI